MKKALLVCPCLLILVSSADTITLSDTTYTDVYVTESPTRYFVGFPNDGRTLSFKKDEVTEVQISEDSIRQEIFTRWDSRSLKAKAKARTEEESKTLSERLPAKTQTQELLKGNLSKRSVTSEKPNYFSLKDVGADSDRDSFYNPRRNPPYYSNRVDGRKTRSQAINTLATQFSESADWVETNMGTSNSLTEIHKNLAHAKLMQEQIQTQQQQRRTQTQQQRRTETQRGRIDYKLVQTLKDSWQAEGWKYKSKDEKEAGIAVMILVVMADITNDADQEATLDYIAATIASW